MGPPTTTTLRKPTMSAQGTARTGREAPAPKQNAFDVMMNNPQRSQTLDKGKGKLKPKATTKPTPAPSNSSKPMKTDEAGPSAKSKMTLKEKMRPREKTQANLPKFVPLPDEDEDEEEYPGLGWFSRPEVGSKMEETRPAILFPESSQFSSPRPEVQAQPERASPGPLEPASMVEDPVMESTEKDQSVAPTPVPDTSMADAEISLQKQDDEPKTAAPEPSQEPHNVARTPVSDIPMDAEIPVQRQDDEPQSDVAPTPVSDTPMGDAEIPVPTHHDEPQSAAPEPSQNPQLAVEPIKEMETHAPESEEVVGENAAGVVETKAPAAAEPTPRPSRASKLPLGKKRQPIFVEPAARVTRSASNSKKSGELSGPTTGLSRSKSLTMGRLPAKRTASGTVKKAAPPEESSMAESEAAAEATLSPGSPMKLSSPTRASDMGSPMKTGDAKTIQIGPGRLSLARTPTKSKFTSEKPASSPSPSKIARSSSYMSMRPPAPGTVRTFSMDTSLVRSGATSSLSTLSNALEKLRMPPPSRPSTSMGFNRDFSGDDDEPEVLTRAQDDGKVGRASLGLGRTDGALKRAATLGAGAFKASTTASTSTTSAAASSSKTTGNRPVQKTLTMFMSSKGSGSLKAGGTGPVLHAPGRLGVGSHNNIFGGIGGVRRTISKKTPLPMVLGSPVKGGEIADETMADDSKAEEDAMNVTEEVPDDNFLAPVNISSATVLEEDSTAKEGSGKGKQKEANPLSSSLSGLPVAKPSTKGLMGPPPTPPSIGNISNRSTGSNASGASSASPSQAGRATRSSARIAKSAPAKPTSTDGLPSSAKKVSAGAGSSPAAPEAKKILDGCVIFVDVKTEAGDEAGSLFVTMLEQLGARVQGRVGQSCTHIVYKNGLPGTLTKHRLLRDPKPQVVGIGWVVECAEQQKRAEEAEFLVDLENAHFAGTHKRRRSMLPKMYSSSIPLPSGLDRDTSGDGDRSVDDTSISLDEDLTPLERVRRRQSILSGPRA
ncbi:hypothetical protein M413DRAFT_446420 [Hebeloma cylindrosporum]|uniref:BRCT domain-containing protein n=1 Tax=Hebeloma cylindrosporum TaxID=76867 RepID=A0A0C3C7Q0_HEBCY|nr:hypothetical protein M413DRAFT_446420 [Hebeloma cylindrosporum h7]